MTNKKPPFGQHFLRHPELAQKIVACLGEGPFGTVVEIGPGKGSLTEALVSKCRRLVLVERDPKLIPQLKGRFELLGVEVLKGMQGRFRWARCLKRRTGIRYIKLAFLRASAHSHDVARAIVLG